ncbi:MAG: hypothetical protein QXP38_01680 [Nitrososphaerota archaeon]
MPRLLDLEIKTGWLVVRVIVGALLSAAVFLLLSYLPLNLPEIVRRFVPAEVSNAAVQVVSGLVHPLLPSLGTVLSILIFLEVLFRKTKAYGPILILAGLVSALYIYFAFHGGVVGIPIPKGITMGVSASAYFDLTMIMLLVMLPALLTTLKGVVMAIRHEK